MRVTQPFRRPTGGRIDRAQPVAFTFDGRTLHGYAGDTLAAALLAHGIHLVGRSFKYHRPRGILSAGPEEPNALMELREGAHREPNTRATTTELSTNLHARSQNRFPSLHLDLLSITGALAPIFAAGFYYKTFMWPAAFWERVYEPLIRRAAGLGRASALPDPDTYDKQTAFADLLVIGAGQAGLTAALAAAADNKRVILADQDFAIGGRLLSDTDDSSSTWLAQTEATLRANPNVRILARTTVTGVYDGPTYAAIERLTDHLPTSCSPRQRLWRIIAPAAILATGAIERPLVFGNNDLPGIMLAGAVRTYLNRFAVRPGTTAAIFANNDDAFSIAADLTRAGIRVAGLIDPRPETPEPLRALAAAHAIPVFTGATIRQASGVQRLRKLTLGGAATGTTLACDLLAVSGGWNPAIHLASHHGGKPIWNDAATAFIPGPMPPGMTAAGTAAGHHLPPATPLWQIPDSLGKSFVDFQNDVTASDITLAAREGFTAVEHLKRYTTLGMATDQGKTSNVTGLALMAAQTGRTIAQTGTTVFRPPYTPVAIGAMAGAHRGPHYRPTRRTPAHAWAEGQGACFIEAGDWLRATHFPALDETIQEATNREVLTVRTKAGFCDVTTLGKIDIQGPDAAIFLDFIYANLISTLAPGRVRYGLMLREDGFAFDDGTVARLAQNHFLLTTTTANAARVLRHLDLAHHILKPGLDLAIEPVTDQWAQFALAGPGARMILAKLAGPDNNFGNAALPFMATATATLCHGAHPARLFRISFSGELAYELAVPASHGAAFAEALHAAGAIPYGLEALNVLRLEKGHPVGAELNGQTTAADLGMAGLLSKKKDFIGRALAQRPALLDPDRETLVGLRSRAPLQAGAHLTHGGHITSAAYSATLGHWIALALLSGGARRTGETLRALNPLQGTETNVEVVSRVFHDPEGAALHG